MSENPYEEWRNATESARDMVLSCDNFEEVADICVDRGERLRAISFSLKGIACKKCGGYGWITYPDTSTWRKGGMAGQMFTDDVCDKCWGTGRTDRTGVDLRKILRGGK
jgi:hypothetical protein